MKIFLTGATGYIGGAVAAALRDAGHDVTALVRAPETAEATLGKGIRFVAGDLARIDEHRDAIAASQVFVHAAVSQENAAALDDLAIRAFTRHHDERYFLYTSGVWALGNTGPAPADEVAPPKPIELATWRVPHERWVLEEGRDNFPTAVIRPGCVYGRRQSLLRPWFAAAEKGQPVQIVGSGTNHWAMIHVDDLARCYVRAVEKRAAGVLHAVDDTRATLRQCAEAVIAASGKNAELSVRPLAEARASMGAFADALAIDQHIASGSTRSRLGWKPQKTFVESVEEQWKEWRSNP